MILSGEVFLVYDLDLPTVLLDLEEHLDLPLLQLSLHCLPDALCLLRLYLEDVLEKFSAVLEGRVSEVGEGELFLQRVR